MTVLRSGLACCFVITLATMVHAEEDKTFEPNWQSLSAHEEAPEWYRDAKFGIYFHWGVYSVPAYGHEWYPRWMHVEGYVRKKKHDYYKHHLETYGHPSEFGYHDFVPMFTAEKFDAAEWAELFRKAGAKYAGPVAEHHDGFAMWDSEVTPWNAADKGPHRDITGELAKEIRKRGMKLVTTFHHARNLQRYRNDREHLDPNSDLSYTERFRNSHYPYLEGMPPTSDDPQLRLLYGNLPEDEWLERIWFGKLKEVIDQYQPELIWFDSWLDQIPEEYLLKFCTYYLNHPTASGVTPVITRKQEDLPLSCSLEDFEKGRLDQLTAHCWLTDDTISLGSWSYTEDLEIKPTAMVLHSLIDIVSKNGCLLLNISPKADGSIPENQREVLLAIGEWLRVNGEAIYNTRPWTRYGEGPTVIGKSGGFIKEPTYSARDIRYTSSKNDLVLYATLLGRPEPGTEMKFTSVNDRTGIESITLLGSDRPVDWSIARNAGLVVTMPDGPASDLAVTFKIVKSYGSR